MLLKRLKPGCLVRFDSGQGISHKAVFEIVDQVDDQVFTLRRFGGPLADHVIKRGSREVAHLCAQNSQCHSAVASALNAPGSKVGLQELGSLLPGCTCVLDSEASADAAVPSFDDGHSFVVHSFVEQGGNLRRAVNVTCGDSRNITLAADRLVRHTCKQACPNKDKYNRRDRARIEAKIDAGAVSVRLGTLHDGCKFSFWSDLSVAPVWRDCIHTRISANDDNSIVYAYNRRQQFSTALRGNRAVIHMCDSCTSNDIAKEVENAAVPEKRIEVPKRYSTWSLAADLAINTELIKEEKMSKLVYIHELQPGCRFVYTNDASREEARFEVLGPMMSSSGIAARWYKYPEVPQYIQEVFAPMTQVLHTCSSCKVVDKEKPADGSCKTVDKDEPKADGGLKIRELQPGDRFRFVQRDGHNACLDDRYFNVVWIMGRFDSNCGVAYCKPEGEGQIGRSTAFVGELDVVPTTRAWASNGLSIYHAEGPASDKTTGSSSEPAKKEETAKSDLVGVPLGTLPKGVKFRCLDAPVKTIYEWVTADDPGNFGYRPCTRYIETCSDAACSVATGHFFDTDRVVLAKNPVILGDLAEGTSFQFAADQLSIVADECFRKFLGVQWVATGVVTGGSRLCRADSTSASPLCRPDGKPTELYFYCKRPVVVLASPSQYEKLVRASTGKQCQHQHETAVPMPATVESPGLTAEAETAAPPNKPLLLRDLKNGDRFKFAADQSGLPALLDEEVDVPWRVAGYSANGKSMRYCEHASSDDYSGELFRVDRPVVLLTDVPEESISNTADTPVAASKVVKLGDLKVGATFVFASNETNNWTIPPNAFGEWRVVSPIREASNTVGCRMLDANSSIVGFSADREVVIRTPEPDVATTDSPLAEVNKSTTVPLADGTRLHVGCSVYRRDNPLVRFTVTDIFDFGHGLALSRQHCASIRISIAKGEFAWVHDCDKCPYDMIVIG